MKTVAGLLYSKEHEWVKVEGSKAFIGVTDYAQHAMGEIVFVELPEVDDEFSMGDVFGVIESVKAASEVYIPVSGKVLEINEALEDSPELINEDAFENWIVSVEITNKSELEGLMGEEEYREFCEKEE
ncbi:glycine cleavage system H protein [Natronincola peptidivorans]|uniref:Glycine cleavage system H protein n=1 Tax=Natronincola peptidivorans TaxID=426128 RepID=A0A1I0B0I1_9FIRM|nr:glycine cleavage system protein GcvH [Natronincola peptidivorans]SET00183.1 glycine cleavage system H protein [Natronincola peptidivorans]